MGNAIRRVVAMICSLASIVLVFLMWVVAIRDGIHTLGFWRGVWMGIPILGQMLWAGYRWGQSGFLNSYTYLWIAAGFAYGAGYLAAPPEERGPR